MSEPERIQVMPDGTRLPIPVHPRFRYLAGEWGWTATGGYNLSLTMLRDGGAGWSWLREWHSCCAVASELWRIEWKKWALLPVNDCKNFDDIARWKAEAEVNAVAWEAEFTRADAELRRA